MSETDPFNCPKCGAHDYGLYAAGLLPCPHCQAAELAAAHTRNAELEEALRKCCISVAVSLSRILAGAEATKSALVDAYEVAARRAMSGEGE